MEEQPRTAPPSGPGSSPTMMPEREQPRSPADHEQLLLLWTDLVERSAEEGDARLLEFYLGSGESQGLERQELLERALRRRPGDPLLQQALSQASSPT